MILSHKIQLIPSQTDVLYFYRASGVARFAYNWALAEWNKLYLAHREDPQNNPKPKEHELRKKLNAIKRTEFPWMLEVTKCAPQLAIKDWLSSAFRNFFNGTGKYPKFKKKGQKDSFKLSNDQVKVDGNYVKIPNLGWVRMRERIRFQGKTLSATVSRTADRWFVSFQIDLGETSSQNSKNQAILGVDLGLKDYLTTSNGEKLASFSPLKDGLKKLQRLSRSLSRKRKGSSNWKKAKMALSRYHMRIANQRRDVLHKASTQLAKQADVICIEDLQVRNMMKNRKLARSISDVAWREFRIMLEYKMRMLGKELVVADKFFASSKLCSDCGFKNFDLKLQHRTWQCGGCGTHHDRDVNAAVNLRNYAGSCLAGCLPKACGEKSSGSLLCAMSETGLDEAGRNLIHPA